jgi:hypothetical protein
MKQSIFVLLLTAMTIGATAQTRTSPIGGYGAGITEIAWLDGKPALNLGAFGGVLIRHRLLIGAAGNNLFFQRTVNGKKENFQFNYYGLYTEYRLLPEKPVHLSVGLTGALGWQENNIVATQKSGRRDGRTTYVIQPKLAINTSITRFMQLQAYGSYRITGNTNSLYYTNTNYNGISAGIGLVFGSF